MINYKEIIITPNDDSTYKLEFIGCSFTNNGEKIEGNIVFPRVSKEEADAHMRAESKRRVYDFSTAVDDDEQEIFTIYIPD